jgi:osmoprotectant transport system permease protein
VNTLIVKAYRFTMWAAVLAAGVSLERTGLIRYLSDPFEMHFTLGLIYQHVNMVLVSMSIATFLGVTIGILFTRTGFKRYSGIVMYIVGLGQTVPSLAVIAVAMSFIGIGFKAAVFALCIYSILPIARNTLAGISSVPSWIIDASRGMGMPKYKILLEIEIPNAMKVILTGFRIALIINIGTAALAFLIGAGGLGDHIFTGISLMRMDKLLAGAIPTTLLALFADYLCEILGLFIIPKGLRLEERTQ